jgi:hypothetical protein
MAERSIAFVFSSVLAIVVCNNFAIPSMAQDIPSLSQDIPSIAQAVPNNGWSLDVTDMDLPNQALTGTVCGNPFSGASAKLTSSINDPFSLDHLVLSTASQSIDIQFAKKYALEDLSNQTLIFTPNSKDNVTVKMTCNQSLNQPESFNAYTGVGLKIKFGTYERGAIATHMILRLPSKPPSYIQGAIAVVPPT